MSEEKTIESMSLEELKDLADTLGETYASNIGEETLRKKLQAKLGEPVEEPEQVIPSAVEGEERIAITIHKSPTDKQPVPVGVNGKTWLIKRGVKVEVPKSVIEILNNAVCLAWDSDMEEYSEVRRYPYTVELN